MPEKHHLTTYTRADNEPEAESMKELHTHLAAEITSQFGPANRENFGVAIKDDQQKLIAGLKGFQHWGWFYITHVWVDKSHQGQGLSRRLLNESLNYAQSKKLTGLYIDTFNEEVKNIYLHLGFELVGKIEDFPNGFSRYYLKLTL